MPRRECNLVIAGYSAKYRLAIIKRWQELDIAELTGKTHDNVLKDIRRILSEVEIDLVQFNAIYLDAYKREQSCFNLPRLQCDLVVSGYSAKYRLAIIKRWQELEVAKLTGKDHYNVMKDIRRILDEAEIDAVRFDSVYLGGNGQE